MCDKCSYVCKREATLHKHINKNHQLDPEEIDIVYHKDSNKKELKKLKLENRELKEKVEHLALGKTKVECEVKRLQTECDSLASLLSLRQNIDNPVLPSKKKKNSLLLLGVLIGHLKVPW